MDRQIGYDEVQAVRVGSQGCDRLDGRPALVVERADGRYLVTSAGLGAGIVQELVDRLAEIRLAAPRRATVIVPLNRACAMCARDRRCGAAVRPCFDRTDPA